MSFVEEDYVECIDKCPMPKKRNLGIDLLKAILAIMIMARHSAVISVVPFEGAGGGHTCTTCKVCIYVDSEHVCASLYDSFVIFLCAKANGQ